MKHEPFKDCTVHLYTTGRTYQRFGSVSITDNCLQIVIDGETLLSALQLDTGVHLNEPWGSALYRPRSGFRRELDILTIQIKSEQAQGDIVIIDRKSGVARTAFERIRLVREVSSKPEPSAAVLSRRNVLSIETALL